MKNLMILVSILFCSFLVYENVTLRLENITYVQYENQQDIQIHTMKEIIEANEIIINEKDTVIEVLVKECDSLAAGVLRLFNLLQVEKDMDQTT